MFNPYALPAAAQTREQPEGKSLLIDYDFSRASGRQPKAFDNSGNNNHATFTEKGTGIITRPLTVKGPSAQTNRIDNSNGTYVKVDNPSVFAQNDWTVEVALIYGGQVTEPFGNAATFLVIYEADGNRVSIDYTTSGILEAQQLGQSFIVQKSIPLAAGIYVNTVISVTSAGVGSFYHNGELVGSQAGFVAQSAPIFAALGGARFGATEFPWSDNQHTRFRFYNRVLSADEIRKNNDELRQ